MSGINQLASNVFPGFGLRRCRTALLRHLILTLLFALLISAERVSAENTQSTIEPMDAALGCYSECLSLGISGLYPVGSVREVLQSGMDLNLWWKPRTLKPVDDFFFANSGIPLWKQIRTNFGIYYGSYTGPMYDRKYEVMGISPGLIHRMSLSDAGIHQWVSQFDLRLGWVTASRTGASGSSLNVQPIFYSGYEYHLKDFTVGLLANCLLSSDANPMVAVGGTLKLGYRFDVSKQSDPNPTTARPEEEAKVEVLPDGIRVNLPITGVSFETGEFSLDQRSKKFAEGFSALLVDSQFDWQRFEVIGHADRRGPENINLKLSLNRAKTLKKELVKQGIEESRIETLGMGSKEPLDPADNEEAWKANRRVEVRAYGKGDREKLMKAISDFEERFKNASPSAPEHLE